MSKKFETPPPKFETPTNISDAPSQNFSEDSAQMWVDKLRIELAKLGLKIIEDINIKRVPKPEETYNSLVNLFNAVKEK
jgi:hypothetical protein